MIMGIIRWKIDCRKGGTAERGGGIK